MKKSKEIAFLGIITALSVVILFLGYLVDVLDITASIFASLLLLIANEELKLKSLMVYFATSIITMIIAPFSLSAIEYIVFALYPILKPLIEKAPKVVAYILKAIYIVLASGGMVAIMYFFVGEVASKPLMIVLYVLMFILVIVLFDLLLVRFKRYYQFKLRHKLKLDRFFK